MVNRLRPVVIATRVTQAGADQIDAAVARLGCRSRSELVRAAVQEYVQSGSGKPQGAQARVVNPQPKGGRQ